MYPIIFFNWDKLSKHNFADISKIIHNYQNNSELRKKYDGKSFLLNLNNLLELKPNIFELYDVLQVASTRNYFHYWFNGYSGAYLDFCGIEYNRLKYNRLLRIDEKKRLIYITHEDKNGN